MTKKKSKAIGFQLKGIEILNINFSHPQKQSESETAFTFDISIEHRIKPDDGLILVACTVGILNELDREEIGKITTLCVYEVEGLNGFVDNQAQQVDLPEHLATAINSISLSTTRGIMYSNFKGTILDKAYLPIISPASFTKRAAESV